MLVPWAVLHSQLLGRGGACSPNTEALLCRAFKPGCASSCWQVLTSPLSPRLSFCPVWGISTKYHSFHGIHCWPTGNRHRPMLTVWRSEVQACFKTVLTNNLLSDKGNSSQLLTLSLYQVLCPLRFQEPLLWLEVKGQVVVVGITLTDNTHFPNASALLLLNPSSNLMIWRVLLGGQKSGDWHVKERRC